jgi:hypothetical protein
VVESLDGDGADQDERNIARILFRLFEGRSAVEATCSSDLHGGIVG